MDGKDSPLLSVVCVTFNDAPGITRTLRSLETLKAQAGASMEVVVQDGSSRESVPYRDVWPWAKVSTRPDQGIYHAMNLALARTSGRFVWFVNGGDESIVNDWTRLAAYLRDHDGTILLGDYELKVGDRCFRRKSRTARYMWHGLPTSHQAIFYPGDLARTARYDLSYKVTGDYAITGAIMATGVSATQIALPVARFHAGGTSQQRAEEIAVEARRVQEEILGLPALTIRVSGALHLISRTARGLLARAARPS